MYKWQEPQWNSLIKRKDTLPHALLLRGRAGVGKHDFALDLASALLCMEPSSQKACGVCASCLWLKEGNHPDFRLISPEDNDAGDDTNELKSKKKSSKKSQISVAQIRQLYDYLSLSTHQVHGKRIVLISPAEMLNASSANALLKMLEEPPANTLFILVSSQPQRLLPTIISRCQAVEMPIPKKAMALSWLGEQGVKQAEIALGYAGGAPLLALQIQEQFETNNGLINQLALGAKLDPFASAPMFMSLGMERALETLQKWIFDLISCKLTQQFHYHSQQVSALQALCKSVNLRLLLRFQQTLVEVKKTLNHPLSNEMQLENVLLQYTHIFKN